jgi:predicted transcriptional regulator
MFMPERNLGISEFAVSRAIMELNQQHERLTATMIAEHIGCEKTAVYRAIARLKEAGKLLRGEGSPKAGGYRYVIK